MSERSESERRDGGRQTTIRAILLDKDGTLVDFDRTWAPAVETVLRHLAGGNDALFRKLCIESGLMDCSPTHFRADSPLIGEPTNVFAERWATLLRQPADPAFFGQIDRLLREATCKHLSPIGDPKAVIGELVGCGYRVGLLTNDAEATARAHGHKLGLDGMLAFVAGYDSGFGSKPDPGAVLAFSGAVGVPPEQIVVVGDTALDVATAQAAGARAVLVLTGPSSSRDAQGCAPDAVIASFAELPAWLKSQRSD